MADRESRYRDWLEARARSGLRRALTPVRRDARTVTIAGRSYVNLSSNDYLGLSTHPALVARAREWAEMYGAGAGASRLGTGNLDLFAGIEAKVAAMKGKEAALIMASGFQANAAVLRALLDPTVLGAEPLVFTDRLNHASLHFGCRAAGARQTRYRACDAEHLGELLARNREETDNTAGRNRPKFIITESIFSMDGTVAPLDRIAAMAAEFNAFLVVDDAHGTGVLGERGRGLGDQADLVIGTFSKGLGSFGAYVACSHGLRDYLVNACAGLIYSTALPPPVLGAIDAALDLVPRLEEERKHLMSLANRLRAGVRALGFDTGGSSTHILPLIAGTPEDARVLAARLAHHGLWASVIRPPTVPAGTARLRLALTAAHEPGDADAILAALAPASAKRATA